jgi:hypothetical protein
MGFLVWRRTSSLSKERQELRSQCLLEVGCAGLRYGDAKRLRENRGQSTGIALVCSTRSRSGRAVKDSGEPLEGTGSVNSNGGVNVVRGLCLVFGAIMLYSGPNMVEFVATVRR